MDTQGIDLLESPWKVMDEIIDTHLRASVHLHNVLHGFRAGRVMGTVILDMKMSQGLVSMDQDPLFLVLIEL